MAYDPTVWKSGDTITSAKLNKLENGLAEASGGGTGGGVLVVGLDIQTMTLDKTWNEIHDGLLVGVVTVVVISEENMEVSSIFVNNCVYDTETSKYLVSFYEEGLPQFSADSPNNYPAVNN